MFVAIESNRHVACVKTKQRVDRQKRIWAAVLMLAAWTSATVTVDGVEPAVTNRVRIELYVRQDSEQCRQAESFLQQFAQQRSGLDIAVYDVLKDNSALSRLWKVSRQRGYEQAKLPTFFLCDRAIVGFQNEATTGQQIRDFFTINVYIRPGCRHCHAAQVFLDQMVQRWPAVEVQYHDAVNDAAVRRELETVLARYHQHLTLFPCIHIADRIVVGFDSTATSGARLEAIFQATSIEATQHNARVASPGAVQLISLLRPQAWLWDWLQVGAATRATDSRGLAPAIDAPPPDDAPPLPLDAPLPLDNDTPELAPPPPEEWSTEDSASTSNAATQLDTASAEDAPQQTLEFELFGRVHRMSVSDFGLPTFTFLVGLIDGFNPCAMWVLVFLLSILVNIKDRKKIILIAGSFVVVSGLAYFAFMAAWLNVFQLIGLQRPVQIALGLLAVLIGTVNVKDFFAFHEGLTFSIPDAAKPGIYDRVRRIVTAQYLTVAMAGAVALAIIVNVVELLCTAGLPAMYTEILTLHQLPTWENYAYLALYNVAYMLDDSILLVIIVVTLSRRRLQEQQGRWLKLVSGVVILALGLAMIFAPDALTWSIA